MIVAGSASPLLLSSAGGYNLTNSLRFRSSASAYLNRTFSTPTNSTKWTWSGWFKLGYASTYYTIFDGGSPDTRFGRDPSTNQLYVNNDTTNFIITTPVYRDYSAWYHAVLAFDSSQGTASNRLRLYINGSEVTAFATDNRSSISGAIGINTATAHGIGRQPSGGSAYFDGYMAEINFVDGQQLTPSSFGETSATTGVWIPKKYTGTYGTNGFYLKFTDTTSTSTLGIDFSGNSNTWTVNNISLTAGSTYDSMTDVPTLTSATAANYCVMSPIASSPLISLTNGNLTAGGTDEASLIGTIGVNSGKWYWEVTLTSGSVTPYLGVSSNSFDKSGVGTNFRLAGISWYGNGNKKAYTATSETSATSNTTGVYGFALDISAGTLDYYFNNSLVLTDTTIPTSGVTLFPLVAHTNSGSNSWNPANFNFGQQPFAYTPPTGFVALNTFNLPTPTIGATASTTANKYFDVTLYTGNGSTQNITNSGSMQPDWAWIKVRSSAGSHALADSVRGSTIQLASNNSDAEITRADTVTSFNSNGFSLGANTTGYSVNLNTATYVAWQWRASNATAVTNTAGSITSTVSANTTAGFSIVTYTGTGANATVGHGLGVAPSMVIVKRRPTAGSNWPVWHIGIANTEYLMLNSSNAKTTGLAWWNSTSPTSTVFSVGSDPDTNGTVAIVAYCFAPVAGYSAFGSYTGNGSTDGPFVYTGFRPKYWLIKRTDSSDFWVTDNSVTSPYNLTSKYLLPNTADAEGDTGSNPAGQAMDVLSNGFKLRNTNSGRNASGGTYIYMAFAENPFKYANAR
jgi:hypothetical protein